MKHHLSLIKLSIIEPLSPLSLLDFNFENLSLLRREKGIAFSHSLSLCLCIEVIRFPMKTSSSFLLFSSLMKKMDQRDVMIPILCDVFSLSLSDLFSYTSKLELSFSLETLESIKLQIPICFFFFSFQGFLQIHQSMALSYCVCWIRFDLISLILLYSL